MSDTQPVQVEKSNRAAGDKQSVLATYDKLIAHTSLSSRKLATNKLSRSVKANQLIGGGLLSDNYI